MVGKTANAVKESLNNLFDRRKTALEEEREAEKLSRFDPSMPGRMPRVGSLHPVTQVMDEICQVFKGLGYDIVTGPEVENDYHNFEALNMPPEHPDPRHAGTRMYVTENILLRTHTSPLQVRTMKERKPPRGRHRSGQGVPPRFRPYAYAHVSSD